MWLLKALGGKNGGHLHTAWLFSLAPCISLSKSQKLLNDTSQSLGAQTEHPRAFLSYPVLTEGNVPTCLHVLSLIKYSWCTSDRLIFLKSPIVTLALFACLLVCLFVFFYHEWQNSDIWSLHPKPSHYRSEALMLLHTVHERAVGSQPPSQPTSEDWFAGLPSGFDLYLIRKTIIYTLCQNRLYQLCCLRGLGKFSLQSKAVVSTTSIHSSRYWMNYMGSVLTFKTLKFICILSWSSSSEMSQVPGRAGDRDRVQGPVIETRICFWICLKQEKPYPIFSRNSLYHF